MSGDGTPLACSARGCRAPASWGVRWNNPRLHTPERRKVWLACDDHRGSLEEFLRARAFHRDTLPVADLPEDPGPAGPTPGDRPEGAS
ncbi:hypothetical protein [Cellulomonas marina]|uniref:Acetone carboxylase n=1 Tax=Cellulomonas marina TaxID=988821 RepID=A0A1I0ZW82_9CELL|nr:hypothetical protein [Cellulomonas marina]SFB28413.1 hypothetical protein SAMN05421867_11293 [Cellulomonas marina]